MAKKPIFIDEVILDEQEAEQVIKSYIRMKKPQYDKAEITVEPVTIKAEVKYREDAD